MTAGAYVRGGGEGAGLDWAAPGCRVELGVTELVGVELAPGPPMLIAATTNVYEVSLVRPDTTSIVLVK